MKRNPVTFDEILKEICSTRRMSARTLYSDLERLGIQHVGPRQRPNLYPADTAHRVLKARGYNGRNT